MNWYGYKLRHEENFRYGTFIKPVSHVLESYIKKELLNLQRESLKRIIIFLSEWK